MDAVLKDSQVSMRLPAALKARMESYAQLTGRSKSHVAAEAITDYLDWRLPQLADLEKAVAAADRGEFATDADVQALARRYAKAAPSPSRKRAA